MLNAKAAVEMVIKQDDTSTEHPKESETTEAKGKRYHLFGHQNFSWEEAKEFCENYSGNLAVVHSQKENDMLMELINMQKENHFISKPCYWLGAEAESTGQWKWVTGENVENYSNWSEGNPDSYDWGEEGRENYLAMIADVEQNDWDSNVSVGQWNDFVNSAEDIGFIGEWENTSFEFTEAQLEIIRTIVSFSREYMLFKSWNEGVDSDTALEKYTINYKEEGLQVYHHCVYNGRFNVQFLPENKYDDSDGGIWVDVKKSDEIISNMFGIFNGMETLFKENEDNVEIKDGKAKIFVGDRGVVSEDIFFDEITQEREDIILNGWHLEYDVNSQVKEGTVENAYRIQVRVRINESGIMENLTFVDLTVEKQ